jgi:hypothetical protein
MKRNFTPFQRVDMTEKGAKDLRKIQSLYSELWKKVGSLCDNNFEKTNALKSLQESSMWLTRSCAITNQKKEPKKSKETIKLNKKEVTKKPKIIIKKRKI